MKVDQEIIRGISLSKSLQWGGRLWRRSPLDMTEQERRVRFEIEQMCLYKSAKQCHGIWERLKDRRKLAAVEKGSGKSLEVHVFTAQSSFFSLSHVEA